MRRDLTKELITTVQQAEGVYNAINILETYSGLEDIKVLLNERVMALDHRREELEELLAK